MTANLLPPEYLKMLDPDHVTGIVTYLAHESSSDVNGEAFEVGGGWYSKIRWQRSAGVRYGTLLKYMIAYCLTCSLNIHFTSQLSMKTNC